MAVIQQPLQGDLQQQRQAVSGMSQAHPKGGTGGGMGGGTCGGTDNGTGGSVGDPRLTECSECSRHAPTAWVDKMLREEAETTKEVARLKAIEASGNIPAEWWGQVRRLRPPHPHHRLAHDIGLLQWVPEYTGSRPAAAVKALESVVACLEAIFGPQRSCTLTALHRHVLGMVLLGMPIRGTGVNLPSMVTSPPGWGKVEPGLASLRRAVREGMVSFGPGRKEACDEAEKDLLNAQMRLAPEDAAALASLEACSFCGSTRAAASHGIGGGGGGGGGGAAVTAAATSMPRCGRCGRAAYCCREHQAIQWPLHKKSCRPRAAGAPAAAATVAVQLED